MTSLNSSLNVIASAGEYLWALRDERNAIDEQVNAKKKTAEKLAQLANKEGATSKTLLIKRHEIVMHEINRLLDSRAEIVSRIAAASSNFTGMANATAKRLSA